MFGKVLTAVLLLTAAVTAAVGDGAPWTGRKLADVIDEFRAAGEPVAYSDSLVTDDLTVMAEPSGSDPVTMLTEMLAPHGLTIRHESGVYLVVRAHADSGELLIVVRARGDDLPVDNASLTMEPLLPAGERIAPGVYRYPEVRPARYRMKIDADGFERANRVFDVSAGETTVINVGMEIEKPEIETITVSASRYEIGRDIATSRFLIDRRTIETMPDVGDDPIRAAHRLPGAAASGASAKAYFRGGELGEVGIILNGQRLFDPFHVRDYQNIFSTIDARAIEGVEVFTGGFPVRYGDRMSGLVLMESRESDAPRHTELGLSVYNTSLLTTGSSPTRRWLFSARRGNLDLVIDPKNGQPKYYDVFGELGFDIGTSTSLSVNALFADDTVTVVLETDPEEREQVRSNTRNAQLWVQLDTRWSDALSTSTLFSATSFSNLRDGVTNDPEKIVSFVRDEREIDEFGLRQDWTWRPSDRHALSWGIEVAYGEANYDYNAAAEYFGLPALYPDQPESVVRQLTASPHGGSYAAYVADRWKLGRTVILEWGLRWDDQTYTELGSDAQLSPRLSALKKLGERSELRLSWGRYHQSQGINELQVEDGIDTFWPAQRADHFIVGFQHLFANDVALRAEAFLKEMHDVRPRFENLYDPLAVIPELQPDRVRLDPASARARGFEVSVEYSTGHWNWWASYTLSRVTDDIAGEDVLRSWDQLHAVQAGIGWRNEHWDVTAAAGAHTGWPTTSLSLVEAGVDENGEPAYIVVPGPRNALRYPGFATLDFRISRRFAVKRGTLSAFLEVSNVTNRRNVCCTDYDILDDDGNVELEVGRDYWLPLLPAVGILWEF